MPFIPKSRRKLTFQVESTRHWTSRSWASAQHLGRSDLSCDRFQSGNHDGPSSLLSPKRDRKPRFFGLGSSRPTSSKPSSAVGRGLLSARELRGGWRWYEESRDWRGRPSGGMMGERAEISCAGGISLWNSACLESRNIRMIACMSRRIL
jgi:hypothetical protein